MRSRFDSLTGFCGLLLTACTQAEAPLPAPTFAELQPRFFAAMRVQHAATRQQQPAFEAQLDQTAGELLLHAERGELATEEDKEAAGRATT